MKLAVALMVAALGAILAFAVKATPSFLNLHVVGWVLILTGIVGVFLPRRSYGWLRRRVTVENRMGGEADALITQQKFSPLLMPGGMLSQNPDMGSGEGPVKEEGLEEYVQE